MIKHPETAQEAYEQVLEKYRTYSTHDLFNKIEVGLLQGDSTSEIYIPLEFRMALRVLRERIKDD